MRVSPALLACCSLVAIAGLPGQAAESAETVAIPSESNLLEGRLPEADLSEAGSPEVSLDRLLGSVTQPAAPQLLSQANPAPLDPGNPVLPEPPDEPNRAPTIELPTSAPADSGDDLLINDGLEAQPGSIDIQINENDVEVNPEETNPDALPVPAAPTNTTPP
ncbi:MAG: hypothetical protein WA947_20780, partial [Phormidesmis sp.]